MGRGYVQGEGDWSEGLGSRVRPRERGIGEGEVRSGTSGGWGLWRKREEEGRGA